MIDNQLLMWGLGLLALSLVLVGVEVFVPSGGVIGVVAFVCAIAGVVMFWRVSWMWGLSSLLAVMVLGPVCISYGLRVLPYTPMGRHLVLSDRPEDTESRAARQAEEAQAERALIGATGSAVTDLRPVGMAEIEGSRIEVMAVGGVIDAGEAVRVVDVEGNRVRVRRATTA